MNNMDQNTLNFIYFLAVIGGIWFIVHISLLVWAFLRMLFPRRNHLENYGANSWAVVTGASDGIGLALCKELARAGFNVCLIARNARKLSDAENEIKEEHPHIETKVVIADFTHSQEEQFFERIADELKTIDVSLLVNNVGVSNIEELQNIGIPQIKQEINVNCVATACLTACIIPRMLSRSLKSGIINMSSSSGSLPGPYISNYSGSKAFVNMLSKGISLELEGKSVETQIRSTCSVCSRWWSRLRCRSSPTAATSSAQKNAPGPASTSWDTTQRRGGTGSTGSCSGWSTDSPNPSSTTQPRSPSRV